MKDEKKLVEELRRFRAKAPSPALEDRVFADTGNGIHGELLRLAALLLIYLGLLFALFPAQSGLASRATERSSLSSVTLVMELMGGSDHD
jgi:hypothetical protein